MDVMSRYPENHFDLAIVDPPYGIGLSANSFRGKQVKKGWDSEVPNNLYFQLLFNKSNEQIIWGGNYFQLPQSQGFIVWDKKQPFNFSSAMCEMAWISIQMPAKIFQKHVVTAETNKIHPTQKPVALYKWLLKNYAKEGDLILDTHGGSGSILIACYEMGFDIVWTELDTDYYNAAIERFRKHIAQGSLFAPKDQYGTQKEIE
jgi:site-specific DNA-methyltransferase (adenine-specific)